VSASSKGEDAVERAEVPATLKANLWYVSASYCDWCPIRTRGLVTKQERALNGAAFLREKRWEILVRSIPDRNLLAISIWSRNRMHWVRTKIGD
jgi:hypothetical protein